MPFLPPNSVKALSARLLSLTTAVQPMATCRQSPYLHKPAIVTVTSFATELATPTVTDTLPRLMYKDSYLVVPSTAGGLVPGQTRSCTSH